MARSFLHLLLKEPQGERVGWALQQLHRREFLVLAVAAVAAEVVVAGWDVACRWESQAAAQMSAEQ